MTGDDCDGIQLALFEVVADAEVTPAQRKPDNGRPRYKRLTGTLAGLCDDCILALYQAHWHGPAPLRAVWERRAGNVRLRLCQSHGAHARRSDGLEPDG